MNKIKDILTVILFAIIIFGICLLSFVFADKETSFAERRKLEQFSSVLDVSVFSRDFSTKLENYFLDQFPLREQFRSINAITRVGLLRQKDVNGLWTFEGSIFKHEDDLKPNQILYGANVINKICESYLSDSNVYYSVIPDKNYFVPETSDHPRFEYEEMLNILHDSVKYAEYIDIFDTLKLEDYYKTDTHWSQDKIYHVVKKLADAMGVGHVLSDEESYTINELSPFYGVYWGQAALSAKPDNLYYLTNEYTENAKVYGIDPKVLESQFGVKDTLDSNVYALDKFEGMDGYDIFLSGAQPVVTIECEDSNTDKELVIFRDSFGSSIAPLFTGAYAKITLVDLRYIPTALLGEFVELKPGQDVLFLYSTSMLNSSQLMR